MTLKTETVAPMPRAKDKIAVSENPGLLTICRNPKRRSCRSLPMREPRYNQTLCVFDDDQGNSAATRTSAKLLVVGVGTMENELLPFASAVKQSHDRGGLLLRDVQGCCR